MNCKSSVETLNYTEKLPDVIDCKEPVTIVENNWFTEINKLESLNDLSYSTTYTAHHTITDSIERNEIRYAIANNSQEIIKKSFDDIKILNSNNLLDKTYNQIMFNTSTIKDHSDYSSIENLTSETDFEKILFIEIRSYPKQNTFKNYINIFIFNSKENDLLYFDSYYSFCDIRDKKNLDIILTYGLSKLLKTVGG